MVKICYNEHIGYAEYNKKSHGHRLQKVTVNVQKERKKNIMNQEERLQAYERMQKDLQSEHDRMAAQMEDLKAAGKTKSVTYKTLLGKKMMYKNMLSMYEIYGL